MRSSGGWALLLAAALLAAAPALARAQTAPPGSLSAGKQVTVSSATNGDLNAIIDGLDSTSWQSGASGRPHAARVFWAAVC